LSEEKRNQENRKASLREKRPTLRRGSEDCCSKPRDFTGQRRGGNEAGLATYQNVKIGRVRPQGLNVGSSEKESAKKKALYETNVSQCQTKTSGRPSTREKGGKRERIARKKSKRTAQGEKVSGKTVDKASQKSGAEKKDKTT